MLYETDLGQLRLFKRGKVRDVYELGSDQLLIIATDRVSCFDVVLPTPIPDKGKVLTQVSLFWFSYLEDIIANHIISGSQLPPQLQDKKDYLDKRSVIVKKSKVVPFECVVRGYLAGSGWNEYKKDGTICGIKLPAGLKQAQALPEPIFTPATKAESGHDENVGFDYMATNLVGGLAAKIRDTSIALYKKAAEYALNKGIIIADTKFEFGFSGDELILIDEVLTPDSSRFWPREHYVPGGPQVSFDKQFVRDYLETLDWDKTPPGPKLPQEIVTRTQEKYKEALIALCGMSL